MESAKLSKDELIDIIFYALKKNNIDVKEISKHEIETIFIDYVMFCDYFQSAYVRGELDTFKRAACLLVAINKRYLSKDKRINASIALDAAYKMCEHPYWNVGKYHDEPKKLEEVNFEKVFENNRYVYEKSKEMLIASLVFEQGSPLSYHLNLELFYQVALELKHNSTPKVKPEPPVEDEQEAEPIKDAKTKKRTFSFFKK